MADKNEEIIVRLTAQVGELKAGMQSAADSVASANAQMAASTSTAAASMKASAVGAAESEEAASVRIKSMVAASLAAKEASIDAGVAEAEADAMAQGRLGQLTAARWAEIEAENDRVGAQLAATATTDSDTAALEGNTAATVENAAAQGAMNTVMMSGNATREYGALLDEALRHNYSRMIGTSAVLGNRLGMLRMLFSPLGLSIAAVTVAVGGLVYGLEQGEEESSRFVAATQAAGGALGITADQFRNMETSIAGADLSIGHAKEAMMAVAQSGRFAGDQMKLVAKGATDMATVTGLKVQQTIGDFEKLAESPVEAVKKLNDQYHFLTVATYDEIVALSEQGKKEEAAALAEKTLADAFATRAKVVQQNLGYLQRAAEATGHFFSNMWDDIEGWGKAATASERIAQINKEISSMEKADVVTGITQAKTAGGQKRIAMLEAEKKALQENEQAAEKTAAATAAAIKKTTDNIDFKPKPLHMIVKLDMPSKVDNPKFQAMKIGAPPPAANVNEGAMAQQELDIENFSQKFAAEQKKMQEENKATTKMIENDWGAVGKAFDQTVIGVIRGTQTWQQGVRKMGASILEEQINNQVKQLTDYMAKKTEELVFGQSVDTAKTASATAAATMQVQTQATATTLGMASEAKSATASIGTSAATAAAGSAASVSTIPVVGWAMAAEVAAATLALVLGYRSMVSAAGGWENVPSDQLAMVHKSEMILPAPIAQAARNTFRGGGRNNGDNHYHVNAMDSRSMHESLRRNHTAVTGAIQRAVKMGAV